MTSTPANAGEVTMIFWPPLAGTIALASFGPSAALTPTAHNAANDTPMIMLRVTDFIGHTSDELRRRRIACRCRKVLSAICNDHHEGVRREAARVCTLSTMHVARSA